MADFTYYLIHPNGREKLKADNSVDAKREFRDHWTADANWVRGKKPMYRRLIETRSEEILTEDIFEE
jgi:hypothetical protein